jgi:hypothetical protein
MGGSTTTVVVMLIVVLHYYMLLVDGASWDEVSSEADGPAPAEGPDDELWLPRAGPPPRVVNVDDYGAADAGVDAAEVNPALFNSLPGPFVDPDRPRF